ncbi:MAG: type II toxin-antitoxin system VapC family toxin [Chloroflexota bacterium]
MFLLDTNIVLEPLKQKPNQAILEKLNKHSGECFISAVIWHELWFGCLRLPKSKRKDAIQSYLENVIKPTMEILLYSSVVAEIHAVERVRLTALGLPPTFVDSQIASTAIHHNLKLVTLNLKDFEFFNNLEVTDWRF